MTAFIVAEAGVNHLGDRAKMLAFCDAAKACGADAVKFQAYNSDELLYRRYARNSVPIPGAVNDLLRKAELSDADLDAIAAHCEAIGFKWFASVFDPSQIERVLSRGACALKIGHAEKDDGDLWHACVDATEHAPWLSSSDPADPRAVLCVEEYPAVSPPQLARIAPGGLQGFSSHYADYRIPAAAVMRGIAYLEAHLKLSDSDPEAAWSLSVGDFTKMVKLAREFESWL